MSGGSGSGLCSSDYGSVSRAHREERVPGDSEDGEFGGPGDLGDGSTGRCDAKAAGECVGH